MTALPIMLVERLAEVVESNRVTAVSGPIIFMALRGILKVFAVICAIVVCPPCPISTVLVYNVTVPSSINFNCAWDLDVATVDFIITP